MYFVIDVCNNVCVIKSCTCIRMLLCYYVIMLLCYYVIMLLCYYVIMVCARHICFNHTD